MNLGRLGVALLLVVSATLIGGCSESLPKASRIVLVTFDTTRADRIGCYGYADADTPTLDALAAEGVLFEQAVSPVPTTLPSHASMFTGLYPHDHGVRYNIFYRLSDEARTLAEALHDGGFATAGFPASQVVAKRFGLDQGFDAWVDPPRDMELSVGAHPASMMRSASDGVDLAIDWLDEQGDQPSFVWLHFYDPHWPYTPPFPFASRYRDRPYDGEIAYADAQLGRLIDHLKDGGRWDETMVVIAGDHGEGLYDHGERFHATLVYESTQRVPLIIRSPGATAGRVDEPVSLVDLMPTILEAARVPGPGEMRGISLGPALRGGDLPRRDIYFEVLTGAITYGWAELYGARYGEWKLIDSGEPELFDLVQDPGEQVNRAPVETDRLEELRQALDALSEPILSDRGEDSRIDLDAETEAMLTGLGYVAGGASAGRHADAPHPKLFVDLEPEILEAQGALATGRYDEVVRTCRYVLTRDPTNFWALNSLSTALTKLGRASEAVEPARELVRLNTESEHAHAALASVLRSLERIDELRVALDAGLDAVPDSEQLLYLRLLASIETGETTACGPEVGAAVERHPESARLRLLDARCKARNGDAAEALESLRIALDLGFRLLDVVENSPDFAQLVTTPQYEEMAAVARESMSSPPQDVER